MACRNIERRERHRLPSDHRATTMARHADTGWTAAEVSLNIFN